MSSNKKKPPKGPTFHCNICNVHVPSASEQSHLNGKKHKLLKDVLEKRIQRSSRSIHVTRLPPAVTDLELQDYFSRFGPVSSVSFPPKKNYCFIEFACKVDELNVLNLRHSLRGRRLLVQRAGHSFKTFDPAVRRAVSSHDAAFQTYTDITKSNTVLERINPDDSIADQLRSFLDVVCLSSQELSERDKFVSYLTEVIQEFLPGARFQIFGSTANGLGFTGCDIDLSLFLPVEREESEILNLDKANVPTPLDIKSGRFPRETLMYLNKENLLIFLMKFIKRLDGFGRTMFIPSARCPIVKFQYRGQTITGDISVGKSLGIANTNLLRLYGQLDFNVHALLVVLRFWGKREGLVGSNHMITSYAFSWLVIFYLQYTNLLPTVETLALLSEFKSEAENWDCTFTDNISIIPVGTRAKSFANLITGFFEFYSRFDFTVQVICPRDGNMVLKSDLSTSFGEDLDFKITSLSVQDVFDLTHNVTASVNDKILQAFLFNCNMQFNLWQSVTGERRTSLRTLFHRVAEDPQNPVPCDQSLLCVSLPVWNFVGTSFPGIHSLCNFVIDIFRRAFLFDCKIHATSPDLVPDHLSGYVRQRDASQGENRTTGSMEEGHILHISCCVYVRTWEGRKSVKGFVSTTETVKQLDIEETIAKELVKKGLYARPPPLLHEFQVIFSLCQNSHQLKIAFCSKSPKKELTFTVIPLLKKYITKLCEAFVSQYYPSNLGLISAHRSL